MFQIFRVFLHKFGGFLQLALLGQVMDEVDQVDDVGQENSPARSSCATTTMLVQPPAPKQRVEQVGGKELRLMLQLMVQKSGCT